LELKFKTFIGLHKRGSGMRKKCATTVVSKLRHEGYIQAAWADDKVAWETHYAKRG